MNFFTIGYGGRAPRELVRLLKEHGVATVVDVRIDPTRASLGSFARARTPDKGIQRLLAEAGIGYVSVVELGNPFRNDPDWRERYTEWLRSDSASKLRHLEGVPGPLCLMCAEKDPRRCHRDAIAGVMVERGDAVTHIDG